MSKIALLLTFLLWLAGCSSSTVDESEMDAAEEAELAEEADTDFLPDDDLGELDDSLDEQSEDAGDDVFAEDESQENEEDEFAGLDDEPAEEQPLEEAPMEEASAVAAAEEFTNAPEEDYAANQGGFQDVNPPVSDPAPVAGSGEMGSYTIQAGDTLMKISFETYGDVYQWRKIYNMNRGVIADYNSPPVGQTIQVEKPAYPVQIDRNGTPYMIVWGDTLGKISAKVYGTTARWRSLWENNRQLIRDPNKIYAGFQLYYMPEDSVSTSGRTPASTPGQ